MAKSKKPSLINMGVLSTGELLDVKKVYKTIMIYKEMTEVEQRSFIASQEKFSHPNNKKFFAEVNRIAKEIAKEKAVKLKL